MYVKHVYTYIQSHLNIIVFKNEAESLVKLGLFTAFYI